MHHAIAPADMLVSGAETPGWVTIFMGILVGACAGGLIAGMIVFATLVPA